jgi:hypothetical protein
VLLYATTVNPDFAPAQHLVDPGTGQAFQEKNEKIVDSLPCSIRVDTYFPDRIPERERRDLACSHTLDSLAGNPTVAVLTPRHRGRAIVHMASRSISFEKIHVSALTVYDISSLPVSTNIAILPRAPATVRSRFRRNRAFIEF